MLSRNFANTCEVIYKFVDSLPAVLRLQVDYIRFWPEEVFEFHTRAANAWAGWNVSLDDRNKCAAPDPMEVQG